MELPVAKQSYLPTPQAMVRAIKRADVVLARTVAQEEALDGATVFFNPARGAVGLANFAADLKLDAPGGDPGVLLDAVAACFAAHGATCAWLDCPDIEWPAPLAALLVQRGWRAQTRRVFLMERFVRPAKPAADLQIIPARAAYAQLRELFILMARQEHGLSDAPAATVADAMIDQLDEGRVEFYLARSAGRPVACGGVLGLGQTGVIMPAFTDSAFRGRGIASTLMTHVLDHCVRSLYEQVLLDRVEGCPSIAFYESLGFREVARYVRYVAVA